MLLRVAYEELPDGGWLAAIRGIPGAVGRGPTRVSALAEAERRALLFLADELGRGALAPAEVARLEFREETTADITARDAALSEGD